MECRKTQEDQNQNSAEVTGFHDDTTEQEVQHVLKETIIALGMSLDQTQINCPPKPITPAFVQFIDNDERDTFVSHFEDITGHGR